MKVSEDLMEIYSGSIMVSAITASPHSSFFFLYSDKHSGTFLIVPGARQSAAEFFCPLITKPRKCTVPASTARKPVDEQADPKEASKKKEASRCTRAAGAGEKARVLREQEQEIKHPLRAGVE